MKWNEACCDLKLRQVLEELEVGFRARDGTYPVCTAHGLQRRKRRKDRFGRGPREFWAVSREQPSTCTLASALVTLVFQGGVEERSE